MENKFVIKNERGYALIEVVFVITVIAILFSIVAPKIVKSLQTVQADYFMKTVYSELRFIEATKRVAPTEDSDIFKMELQPKVFIIKSQRQNIKVTINNETYRSYKMPSDFNFEKNFEILVSNRGIFNDIKSQNKNSVTIRLKNDSKNLKPYIVFDSVGRLRFSNE